MEYLIHIAILCAIYGILAASANLVVGYTGILSIAHASFFGIGAYATAILTTRYDMDFFLSLVVGAIIAGVIAALVGGILSRLSDDYYALGSFGFNIIAFSIMLNWQDMTRGPLGIPGIPRPEIFGFSFRDNTYFLILAAIICGLVFLFIGRIIASSFGRAIQAIREDEGAVKMFGYKTAHFKSASFIVGASVAAVAGSLFASYISFIDPSSFSLNESIFILAIIILGGLGSLEGSIVGAVVLILLPEILRFVGFPTEIAAQMRQVVYGSLLVLLMLYRPIGLLGKYRL
jgi:branched-chain amino acid transport system permease protein